jgi:type II secretory pathway pseudopilin PulG
MWNTRRGFTLTEGLIAAVILAAAVGGMLAPMSATYQQSRIIKQSNIAISMAQQLLDEVVSRHFLDPNDSSMVKGPDSGEATRSTYDNIDDYHNYSDTTDPAASNSIKTLSGDAIDWKSSEVYTRSVNIEYRATPTGPATASGDFAMVTVKVRMPSGQSVSVSRLVARYPRGS